MGGCEVAIRRPATMVMMRIRSATAEDVGTIAALHAESWRSAYREIMPAAFLEGPVDEDRLQVWRTRLAGPVEDRPYVALAQDESGVLGFACLIVERPEAVLLDNLHVRPGRTGSGIGRALLHHCFDWMLTNRPGSRLFLWVYARNAPAIGFYEKLGALVRRRRREPFEGGVDIEEVEYEWPPHVLRDSARADPARDDWTPE